MPRSGFFGTAWRTTSKATVKNGQPKPRDIDMEDDDFTKKSAPRPQGSILLGTTERVGGGFAM